MWFYADRDGGFQRHLIVAKLNDPDDAATRHLNLDRSLVRDGHACSQSGHNLCDAMFPGDA